MSAFTAWVTGRGDDGEPYADQFTVQGSRSEADHRFTETLLPGEEVRSVREGTGGADITLREGSS